MNIIKVPKNKLPKYVYLLVSNDKYELPLNVSDTIKQMSDETGIAYECLYFSYYRNTSCCSGRYKVLKVNIEDEEEKFNFQDYKNFCAVHNLKPTCFNNVVKYKRVLKIYY